MYVQCASQWLIETVYVCTERGRCIGELEYRRLIAKKDEGAVTDVHVEYDEGEDERRDRESRGSISRHERVFGRMGIGGSVRGIDMNVDGWCGCTWGRVDGDARWRMDAGIHCTWAGGGEWEWGECPGMVTSDQARSAEQVFAGSGQVRRAEDAMMRARTGRDR